jgi:hypothetical protein
MNWYMNTAAMLAGLTIAGIAGVATLAAQPALSNPTQATIDNDDIGGTVTSRFGPEGSGSLQRRRISEPEFAKMVVTDDLGRFVMPDLPKANYQVWVRGYGLVDSPKTSTSPE